MLTRITYSLLILHLCAVPQYAQTHLQVLSQRDSEQYQDLTAVIEADLLTLPPEIRVKNEKQYRRWQMFTDPHIGADGKLFNYAAKNMNEFYKNPIIKNAVQQRNNHGHWIDVTPGDFSITEPTTGRVNVVVIHPTNPNIIYVGAAMGGLWKSTNGGSTWACLTDGLPVIGISGLVIHPTQPDIMYMLTGDAESQFIPSIGILKSTNGGVSWQPTALKWSVDSLVYAHKLIMDKTYPDRMLVATTKGIFRTVNGWHQLADVYLNNPYIHFDFKTYDLEYHPTDSLVAYASTANKIYRTESFGYTWHEVSPEDPPTPPSSRIALAVTEDAPDRVYALYAREIVGNGYVGLFTSPNQGGSWNQYTDTLNIVGDGDRNQVIYDLVLGVDPADSNKIYAGGVFLHKSNNGGQSGSWSNLHSNTVHADFHDVQFRNGVMYVGCDGGISKSFNGGLTWINISIGMNIMQTYDMDAEDGRVIAGNQDTGTSLWEIGDTEANRISGSDGFECMLHPNDINIIYASTQNVRSRSIDGGMNFTPITPPGHGNPWGNSWIMHPTNPDTLYCAFNDIARTYDGGDSWNTAANPGFGQILAMAQGVSNPNVFYASDRTFLARTDNIHATVPSWTNVTANFPFAIGGAIPATMRLGGIAVDATNPQRVWVTLRGYSDGNKVFFSSNGGGSWTNVSEGLPNVPFYTIVFQSGSSDGIYVCSDIGVFYKNSTLTDWIYWSNGLPTVRIEDLNIDNGYLYAGTLGRGVWRSGLFTTCPVAYTLTQANDPSSPNSTGYQIYDASQSITTTRIVTGGIGSEVYYHAGNFVDLKPGFWAKEQNFMEAKISGCPN